jgi:diaminohydroxyphosphoribosylaminopyrimidine deaminase/5-amino-6-(5-phosphoribosylamino)uracil reductase
VTSSNHQTLESDQKIFDHQCMARAVRLAGKNPGLANPNPSVGAVISSGRRIIGEGSTQAAGKDHAEIVALKQARKNREAHLPGSTVYVSLEPCSHHGRTPPCTDALIKAEVARVVIASSDPNPLVNGKGISQLRDAGIVIETGLMDHAAQKLNPGFFKRMKTGMPWVRVKTAQSLDGRTALAGGESKWISGDASRQDVQRWRARSSAILTGVGTVLADDPRMTVRSNGASDQSPKRQPLKVVVDSYFRSPADSRIFSNPNEVIVAGLHSAEIPVQLAALGVEIIQLTEAGVGDGVDLRELMVALARREINEVQVEAGSRLCGSLLTEGLVDEILIYQAPLLMGEDGPASFRLGPYEQMSESLRLKVMETRMVGMDLRLRLYVLPEQDQGSVRSGQVD